MAVKESVPALKIKQLTVNYDTTPVLWDVDLEVPQGKCVGIIGPNGAGKSTLLKAMMEIVKPLSGCMEFWGKPLKKVRSKIAYVPQRSSVDWDFPITAYDLVLMGRFGKLGLFKWSSLADREAARKAMDLLGMDSFAKRQISQLSGGQQQRLFLARALLQEADMLLMDEPFAGVDMATEKVIISVFDQLKKEGKTLFVVHHDLHSVEQYFDWVIMLNTSLVCSGPTESVFHEESIAKTYGKNTVL